MHGRPEVEAVTIHDTRVLGGSRVLAVDLIDILRLCEQDVLASAWRLSYVDCFGALAGEFMRLSAENAIISGSELIRLAAGVQQVVWGDFEGFRCCDGRCWLVVRAIDASLYVVVTADPSVLKQVQSRFSDVRPSPDDAAEWDLDQGLSEASE